MENTTMKTFFNLYSDGACSGNPGIGGYACIIKTKDSDPIELMGGKLVTTNNQMELLGVIVGIEYIDNTFIGEKEITVTTDSQYVCKAFNEHWIDNWQMNGWKTSGGKPVANKDLWERLLSAMGNNTVKFEWVRGHNGHKENERCDKLAVMQINILKSR